MWKRRLKGTTAFPQSSFIERLREQQQRESAMLAVYTTDSQPVRSLRLQIEETRKMLAGLPPQIQPIVDMGVGCHQFAERNDSC